MVIKNFDRHIESKKEIVNQMRNGEALSPDDAELFYVFSNRNSLHAFNSMLILLKEDLEKEEKIINEWLLTVNRGSFNRSDHFKKDIIQAVDYLEKHYCQSEWLCF